MEAIRLALRRKADLAGMVAAAAERALELVQGPSVGAVWLLSQLARDLGIVAALGSDRQGKLALWQVIARVLDQGSRLSAVRLAGGHAAGAALGMISFDEDDLSPISIGWRNIRRISRPGCLLSESRRRRRMCFSTT